MDPDYPPNDPGSLKFSSAKAPSPEHSRWTEHERLTDGHCLVTPKRDDGHELDLTSTSAVPAAWLLAAREATRGERAPGGLAACQGVASAVGQGGVAALKEQGRALAAAGMPNPGLHPVLSLDEKTTHPPLPASTPVVSGEIGLTWSLRRCPSVRWRLPGSGSRLRFRSY